MGFSLQQVSTFAHQAVPLARFAVARATGRKFPLMVTLELTDRCNFRCVYCQLPQMEREEMSTAEWHRAIDELADAGMMRVSLMGGEPLLRKDIGELIDHLKERHVNVAMNTNGWLFPNKLEIIRKLDLVCITLDGPAEIHDGQRHPGSHDKVLKAIDIAKEVGTNVITMTVMTAKSIHTVDYVLKVAKEKGIRSFFQIEHDSAGNPDEMIGPGISEDGIAEVARHLLKRKEEGWPVGPSKTYLTSLAGEETGRRRTHSCAECNASRYFLSVSPEGNVIPCPLTFRQEPKMNGRTMGFAKAFEQLQQPMNSGCGCNPTSELNYLLSFRPEAIFNAFDLV
jgi:MoaA/NifB/PqqE/SkfB family radical SAM enzyme